MSERKVTTIRPQTLALFEGSLGAIWGLALAIVVFFQATGFGAVVTDSFLEGLVFGLSSSALVLVAVPLLYFAIGWVMGYVHAWIFNGLMRVAASPVVASEEDVELVSDPAAEVPEPAYQPAPRPNRWEPAFGERIPQRPKPKKRL